MLTDKVRLTGEGEWEKGGQSGDLYVAIRLIDNPIFEREGNQTLTPLTTPAGMFTDKVLFSLVAPRPLHGLHGSFIVCPDPEHAEHVCCTEKNPCCNLT